MTKKDYIRIAAALLEAKADGLYHRDADRTYQGVVRCAIRLADTLADENSSFDRARFLAACGVS